MASYATEREIVAQFLSVFGIDGCRLTDPNAGLKKDTGADVVWTREDGEIGFQITEYHSDKGLGPNRKGSQLRRAEKAKAASGRPYGMWVNPDPIPALVSAIAQKVGEATRPDRRRFREVILLIAASLPHNGVGSTFLLDFVLESKLPQLNAATHDLRLHNAYDAAYIFNLLSLEGRPVVHEWGSGSGWRRHRPLNKRAQHPVIESDQAGLQTIRLLRLHGMPQPGPGSLTDGLGPDFFPALLTAFPDREPNPAEIMAFERSFRGRRRTSSPNAEPN